jgi:hypothetical protein
MAKLNQALGTDLAALAKLLKSKGRGNDTMLAHITPKEAALLKRMGGSGTINPDTGLPEFDDGGDFVPAEGASFQAPAPSADIQPVTPTVSSDQAAANQQSYGLGATPAFDQTTQPGYGAALQTNATQIPAQTTANMWQGEPGQVPPAALASTPDQQTTGQVNIPGGGGNAAPGWLGNAVTQLTNPNTLAKLGLAGGLGLFGASQARKSAGQVNAAQGQEQALATPYQQQGQTLINQAQAGQLSPASQQAFQAAKAQMNQQIANTGGVGVQQAATQAANIYQTLLNNQYTYGLNVMQIGDNIALGAIKTGLQLDQQLNQATTNFYSQLAQMVGGTNITSPGTGKTI